MKRRYPRYFILTDSFIEKSQKDDKNPVIKYAMIKKKGGLIFYQHVDGRFGIGRYIGCSDDPNEDCADEFVEENLWKEVNLAEAACIV